MTQRPYTRETIRVYWQHVRRYPYALFLSVFGIGTSVALESSIPLFYKMFFDAVGASNGQPTAAAVSTMGLAVMVIFGIKLTRQLFHRLGQFAAIYMQTRVMTDLNQTAFKYMLRHSHTFFLNSFAGSLVRRVNRLSRSFEEIADQLTFNLLPMIVSLIGVGIIVTRRSSALGWLLGGWLLAFFIMNFIFARWKQKFDLERAAMDSKATGVLADAIGNSTTIHLFSGYKFEHSLFHKVMEEWRRVFAFGWRLNEGMDAIQGLLMAILEFLLLAKAITLWKQGLLTIGDFALIQTGLLVLFKHLWEFGRIIRKTASAMADAAEMVEIMETPHEIQDVKNAKPLLVNGGKIEFKNVTFSFNKIHPVLNRFNLIIAPGERVALVGSSGAGKSTITNLVLRFYDIHGGKILIDGQDIAKVTQDSLHDGIALVPQEPILFHRTLQENIRYGRREATDAEVAEAAKRAHCHEFIGELPQGYTTYVGERGVKLSGGERQRVAIARAILKNAPILVLDEATSSLDSESEALIQDALRELMKGKTAIVIAHRLSTIMQMDRIIVIDEGKVVDEGTHEELLKRQGIYKKLWEIQAGGFLP